VAVGAELVNLPAAAGTATGGGGGASVGMGGASAGMGGTIRVGGSVGTMGGTIGLGGTIEVGGRPVIAQARTAVARRLARGARGGFLLSTRAAGE